MKFLKLKTTIACILCCMYLSPLFSQKRAFNNNEELNNITSEQVNLAEQKKVDLWEVWSKLGKGYSLANWLEAGWLREFYPDKTAYTKEMLELFAKLGFNTIRMPVLYEWLIDENPPYNSITGQIPFDLFETVIKPVAEEYDQMVIIDNHHGKDLTDANFMQEIPRICGQWIFLTKKYKDLPHDQYLFELRNEPTNTISNENLRVVQQAIIDSIRNYDTERILIVGANWWNASWSLVETQPYDDPNMIYTFHSYTPFNFTHQGQPWHSPYINPDITFNKNDQGAIDLRNELVSAKSWSDEHDVPVFWGEFGVSWYADEESRCNYIKYATCTANELNIPWIYWDIKNSDQAFGIFEEGVVVEGNVIPCFAEAMFSNSSTSCDSIPLPPPPPCEQILNGTFEIDLEPWYWWNANPILDKGAVRIKDIVPTANPWDVGFSTEDITYENGKQYEITFEAYAANNRPISVKAGLGVYPFNNYHFEELNITTIPTNYKITFTMNAATTKAGSLEFYLGGNNIDVILDNVSLKEVGCYDEEPLPPPCPLLEKYSWLNSKIDMNNCESSEGVQLFMYNGNTFLSVHTEEGTTLYFKDGSIWCTDAFGLSCLDAFGFDKAVDSCFCNDDKEEISCVDGIQNGDETGVDCGGKYCEPCKEIWPPIFESYPELIKLVDPFNCNGEAIEVHDFGNYVFIHISKDGLGNMYYNEAVYCQDYPNFSCLSAYNLTEPTMAWSCNNGANPGKVDENESFGTQEKFNENPIKIFPNPNNGQFMLDVGAQFKAAKQIQVTDIQGKVIELIEIDPTAQPLIPVNLQGYNTGNYLLHLIAGDWIKSQTVVIK